MKYFKHELLSRDNDKIFELIEAHGMQGYGIWWAIVEELYKAESNGFQIEATETWFKRLSKLLSLTDWRTLIRTLDTMAEHGLIDPQLWAEHVIHAPGIIERADDYMRQKELAAERKRAQRERDRIARDAMSRVTGGGHRQSHAGVATNSDPDPDPKLEKENTPPTPQGGRCEVVSFPEPVIDAKPRMGARRPTVDVMAWVMSHNQHKPKRWAGVRKLSPKAIEYVQKVIEFYDGDQAQALEAHGMALEYIKRCDNPFWRDECNGDFVTIIRPNSLDERIVAWAELERSRLELSTERKCLKGFDADAAQRAIEAEMAAQLGGAA